MNAFLSSLESKTIADQMLAHFILPNGLPKLVLIHEDSLFKTKRLKCLAFSRWLITWYHLSSMKEFCVNDIIDTSTRYRRSMAFKLWIIKNG
jgi:hypothetical protein